MELKGFQASFKHPSPKPCTYINKWQWENRWFFFFISLPTSKQLLSQ